ncbi:MAG: S-layer domain protein [Desulfotomaculum sp. 46_80]|nr:MAG: S-layer domain protein [Desulfotomaculum sp. 46_80]
MRGSFKKIILALCLAAILLITGAGMSLASDDYGQLISDLGPFFGQLHNLTPEQLEQAVEISDAMAQNFFNCLSDEEEAALKDTLDIDENTYLNIKIGLVDDVSGYLPNNPSGGATGYQGFLNAIDPVSPDEVSDEEYLNGLINWLHDNSINPETLAQLNSKGISFDEFVMFMVKLSQIQFGPGLVVTDGVRDQFDTILDWLVSVSDGNLTRDDLTACGLTVDCLSAMYDQLTQDQKDQLEAILNTMGLIVQQQTEPEVGTDNGATDITCNSATLNGNIINGADCNERKFQYRQQGDPDWIDAGDETGTFGTGAFSFGLTGLDPDTTYEYKAMAHNSAGWGESQVVDFTTPLCIEPEPPLVESNQPADGATGVDVDADTEISATFDRDVTLNGGGVVIRDGSDILQGVTAALNGRTLNISHPALQFETTYTVTIPDNCVQSGGVGNDEHEWSFTTKQSSDVYCLTLDLQYNDGNDTVTASGTLTRRYGDVPERDVSVAIVIEKGGDIFALGQMLTNQNGEYEFVFSTAGFGAGTYTVMVTANAVQAQGSFTIPGGEITAPTVTTENAADITCSGATLKGNITSNGGADCDQRKFVYRRQGVTEWTDAGVETGTFGIGAFSFNLTGLDLNTSYEYSAMAHNSAGWSVVTKTYFTTLATCQVIPPTVTTSSATNITTGGATLNGNITNVGGADCDQRKFVYRKQGVTEWTDAGVETPGPYGSGAFSFALTGLTSNTPYEYKAMAHNSAGWGEGQVVAFTTTKSGGGGGGGGGGSSCELNVDTYVPAANAENVAIDAVVKVTFKQNIAAVDLTKLSVKDAQNNVVSGVKATVDGKVLTIAHDNFNFNTKYTISIPYGTVKRADCSAQNASLNWSFTTAAEEKKGCAYTDVPESYWASGVIKELCEKGILNGYPDGTFRPRNDITRAEFTKIIAVALGLAEENPATPTFKDVSPNDWYYGVIEAAAKANLVKGYGKGLFKPNAKITREEIAAILIRALGKADEAAANASAVTAFKDDHNISAWARGSVAVAVKEGIIKGYPNGTFGPGKNAIRAEVCAMVSRMLAKL